MKKYQYMADMGSIKIMTTECSIFFGNDYGDGIFDVVICEAPLKKSNKFIGHFTIFNKAWLMYSDCMIDEENKIHEFGKGRYFVELDEDGTTFYIYKVDEDLHA